MYTGTHTHTRRNVRTNACMYGIALSRPTTLDLPPSSSVSVSIFLIQSVCVSVCVYAGVSVLLFPLPLDPGPPLSVRERRPSTHAHAWHRLTNLK